MLLILIGIFAVVSITMLVLDLKTGWNVESYDSRNAVVFEGRSQDYGAFELRRNYNKRIMFILGGMLVFSLALMGVKKFMDRPKEEEVVEKIVNTQIDLTPPPPPPPPPMVEMVKFVPPVIKDDAVEEEPQKLQEEVKETNVGVKDQEGDKDIIAPPTEVKGPTESAAPEIFTIVEEMPEPPGGIGEFYKYVGKSIVFPNMAREAGISGKAHVKFVIDTDGSITDITILKGVPGCSDCDKEAIRVLKAYPQKWKPGKMTGRAVKCYYTLPINFKIQ